MRLRFAQLVILGLLAISLPRSLWADQFSSASFEVNDPILAPGGSGFGTSSSYQLYGVVGQLGIGTTSASSFSGNIGWLYFPIVTTPALSATAGDGVVDLSWTAASGFLGWVVSGYNYGQATVSGGPYAYASVGSTTSATASGLTNGTTYYFVLRPEDAFGNSLATSSEVSAAPSGAVTPAPSGAVSNPAAATGFNLTGLAAPGDLIKVYLNGVLLQTVVADEFGRFVLNLGNLPAGVGSLRIIAEDQDGRLTNLLVLPVTLVAGQRTPVAGAFLSPTLAFNAVRLARGDDLLITGRTVPRAQVFFLTSSARQLVAYTRADDHGYFAYALPTAGLALGEHAIQVLAIIDGLVSQVSKPFKFTLVVKAEAAAPAKPPAAGPFRALLYFLRLSPVTRQPAAVGGAALLILVVVFIWWQYRRRRGR